MMLFFVSEEPRDPRTDGLLLQKAVLSFAPQSPGPWMLRGLWLKEKMLSAYGGNHPS